MFKCGKSTGPLEAWCLVMEQMVMGRKSSLVIVVVEWNDGEFMVDGVPGLVLPAGFI